MSLTQTCTMPTHVLKRDVRFWPERTQVLKRPEAVGQVISISGNHVFAASSFAGTAFILADNCSPQSELEAGLSEPSANLPIQLAGWPQIHRQE